MEQLEVRVYERQEIAEITGVKQGSHNFIRDVRNRLEKWGYTCETPNRGPVIITSRPTTAGAKLKEIMLRLFKLDTQIAKKDDFRDGTLDFACFLDFMLNEPYAETMPWAMRHTMIKDMYGMDIAEITLRRWASHLIQNDILHKSPFQQDSMWWKTTMVDYNKYQEPVPDDEIDAIPKFFQRRAVILQEKLKLHDKKSEAWKETYKELWREFGCCYYRCRCLRINGIGNDEIDTILTLISNIIEECE